MRIMQEAIIGIRPGILRVVGVSKTQSFVVLRWLQLYTYKLWYLSTRVAGTEYWYLVRV
jgi:hypothetical protein